MLWINKLSRWIRDYYFIWHCYLESSIIVSIIFLWQKLINLYYYFLILFYYYFFFQDISRNLKNYLALKIYLALRKSHLQRICNVFNVKTGNSNSFEQRLRVKIIINGYYFLKNLQQCALPQECASYDIFNSKKIRLILDTSTRYYYLSKNIN